MTLQATQGLTATPRRRRVTGARPIAANRTHRDPDCELIARCADLIATDRAIVAKIEAEGEDANTEGLWDTFDTLHARIVALRATTLRGMRAKAEALRVDLPMPNDGRALSDSASDVERMAWSLMNDLLALTDA